VSTADFVGLAVEARCAKALPGGNTFHGTALLTRREAAKIGRFPLGLIDKAIEQGVLRPKRAAGKPLFPAHEVGLLVLHDLPSWLAA
jgi:hypothetical protein